MLRRALCRRLFYQATAFFCVARGLHTLLAVAALCLLLSPLALAAFKGRGAPASFQQPAQPFYDPEYVSPPPAEVASFSLEEIAANLTVGSKPAFKLKLAVSTLEYGPFILGWWADYSRGWEGVWWSPWFNGPGLIHLDTQSTVESNFKSFGFPLFVSKNGSTVWASTAWVQSIDFYSLDNVNVKCLCTPSIKDVAVEEHRDLGGIVIRVTLHAPASWSTFRLRVYCGNRLVYDFMKRVSIPEKWESSPIDLRADFGPIRLRKAGTYTIQVDGASGGVTDSRVVTYEKLSDLDYAQQAYKTFTYKTANFEINVTVPRYITLSTPNNKRPAKLDIYLKTIRALNGLFRVDAECGIGIGIEVLPSVNLYIFVDIDVSLLGYLLADIFRFQWPIYGVPSSALNLENGDVGVYALAVPVKEAVVDLESFEVGKWYHIGSYNIYVVAEEKLVTLCLPIGNIIIGEVKSLETPGETVIAKEEWQKYEELKRNYDQLQSNYERLRRDYDNLASLYQSLQSSYRQLQSDYNALKSELEQIKRDYDNLLASYQSLQNSQKRLESELTTWRLASLAMLGSTITAAALATEGWRRARTVAKARLARDRYADAPER
jgi:uncharacterized membrane-anchored protein YhcB (DUF1043 family)